MSTSDWIQLATLIVYAVGVIGTIIHSKKSIKAAIDSTQASIDLTKASIDSTQASIDLTKEQIKVQMFAEYTRRYNEIILHMPDEPLSGSVMQNPKMVKYLRLFFNLCSEEYHLQEKGMIDPEVWEIWIEGMQITMNNITYQQVWDRLKGDYNRDFYKYFQDHVIDWKKNVATTSDTKAESNK